MILPFLAVFTGFLAIAGSFLYDRACTLGVFRTPENYHAAGSLRRIDNTINCEDLHLHKPSGLLFTACQGVDGRHHWFPPLALFSNPAFAKTSDGGLRVIDPNTFTATKLKLIDFDSSFTTHGIDVITDPLDPKAVYIQAINHTPNPEYARTLNQSLPDKAHSRVEIFRHELGTNVATHVRTVRHRLITTPNDLLATGPLDFYVTNDHFYREGHMRVVEDIGNRITAGWSTTVHVRANEGGNNFDGVEAHVAMDGLHNNNGLGKGETEDDVLICDAAGGVTYLTHTQPDHWLKMYDQIKFDTSIDNPFWFKDAYPRAGRMPDSSGVLNAGLIQGSELAHAIESGPIPSVIWLATRNSEKGWDKRRLFEDDGAVLRSASAAVMISIDPATNANKKQAWLYATGFASTHVIAVKVDL